MGCRCLAFAQLPARAIKRYIDECLAGEAPGPRESTIEEVTCPLGTCTLSEITCTPYGPPGDNASSGAGHLGGGGP